MIKPETVKRGMIKTIRVKSQTGNGRRENQTAIHGMVTLRMAKHGIEKRIMFNPGTVSIFTIPISRLTWLVSFFVCKFIV